VVFSLTENVKTVSELKKKLRAVLRYMHDSGKPVVVTVNGKPDAVLMEVEMFERMLRVLNITQVLARGEEDIRRGRTRSTSRFLQEFRRAKKIPC